jgi:hypothetical protein
LDIHVSDSVDVKAVGVDLRARHHQVNLHQVPVSALRIIRALQGHATVRDAIVEARQVIAQFAGTLLEGSRTLHVEEGQNDRRLHLAIIGNCRRRDIRGFRPALRGVR